MSILHRVWPGLTIALAPFASAADPAPRAPSDYIQLSPRTVDSRVFDVWRNPGRFTKNPDIIDLPSGRLLLVYADDDRHWSQEAQDLTILASDDQGRTWTRHGIVRTRTIRSRPDGHRVGPRLVGAI